MATEMIIQFLLALLQTFVHIITTFNKRVPDKKQQNKKPTKNNNIVTKIDEKFYSDLAFLN